MTWYYSIWAFTPKLLDSPWQTIWLFLIYTLHSEELRVARPCVWGGGAFPGEYRSKLKWGEVEHRARQNMGTTMVISQESEALQSPGNRWDRLGWQVAETRETSGLRKPAEPETQLGAFCKKGTDRQRIVYKLILLQVSLSYDFKISV